MIGRRRARSNVETDGFDSDLPISLCMKDELVALVRLRPISAPHSVSAVPQERPGVDLLNALERDRPASRVIAEMRSRVFVRIVIVTAEEEVESLESVDRSERL